MQNKSWILVFSVIAAVVVIALILFSRSASSPNSDEPEKSAPTTPISDAVEPTPVASECVRPNFDSNGLVKLPVPKGDIVVFDVANFGKVKFKLAIEEAPKTTENFKKLVSSGFYNCLTFHRIAPGFVIQGGDPNGDGTGGPGFTVPAEIKLAHKRGSLAAARLPDVVNPKKESSGSQFYIALNSLPALDGEYTVFGEVVEGFDVVEKIAHVELAQKDSPDSSPKNPVVITSAVVESAQ